ncbi:MAG TPA: hypothetical protein V6C50_04360 [Crinalium sp.]
MVASLPIHTVSDSATYLPVNVLYAVCYGEIIWGNDICAIQML